MQVSVQATEQGITRVGWDGADSATAPAQQARHVLNDYFAGKQVDFNTLTFAPQGTPFQQRVWQAMCEIPYGETVTYGDIAKKLNSSPRAVGGAVGANPIPILIPCHRVMGANGAMTGYSGAGGIATKKILLELEKIKVGEV